MINPWLLLGSIHTGGWRGTQTQKLNVEIPHFCCICHCDAYSRCCKVEIGYMCLMGELVPLS